MHLESMSDMAFMRKQQLAVRSDFNTVFCLLKLIVLRLSSRKN